MIVCTQCNGSKGMQGQEATQDPSGNSSNFHNSFGNEPPTIPCTQCGGRGFMTGGSF